MAAGDVLAQQLRDRMARMQPGTGPLMADPGLAPPDNLAPAPMAPERPVLSAEQVDALNPQTGRGKLNSLGKEIGGPSFIAPAQVKSDPSTPVAMRPVYNYLHQQIGMEPVPGQSSGPSNGANNNPFTSTTKPVLDSTGGNVPLVRQPESFQRGEGEPAKEEADFANAGGSKAEAPKPTGPAKPAGPSALTLDQQAIAEAYKAKAAAAGEMADAEKHALDASNTGAALMSAHHDETAKLMDEARAKADEHYSQLQKQFAAANEDAVKKAKIDPDHWSSNASIGQKIAFVIASALGGWASSKTGGPNVGLQAINGAIDKDIASQREAIEGRKQGLDNMKGPLADALRRTQSMPEAVAIVRAQALEGVKARVSTMGAGAQSEKVDANKSALLADLQAQQAKDKQAYDMAAARSAAAAAKGPNEKEVYAQLHQYSEDREKAGLAPIDETLKDIDGIVQRSPDGLPGSSFAARVASHLPGGRMLLTSDARRLDGDLTSAAEAMAHANGQRGTEAIEMNKEIIKGNGSPEDLKKGLALVRRQIAAREANVNAGFRPEIVQAHKELEGTYRPAPQKVIPKTRIQ